jgi:hypothetical protein
MVVMMILLLPAVLLAAPTMGVYFHYNGGQMSYSPTPFEMFDAYVYAHNTECYLDAAEFEICYPAGILQAGWEVPTGSLTLGDPDNGVSITYWPPMDGWNPGYNLLCTLHLLATAWCADAGGTLVDAPLKLEIHHETGHIYGSCWPENNVMDYIGLTSTICPACIGTQDKSWGAIKSLF